MRRPETDLLHGPWDDSDQPDSNDLTRLSERFAGRWIIWRAVDPQRTPGAWCARRADDGRAPAGVTAASSQELWGLLEEADR